MVQLLMPQPCPIERCPPEVSLPVVSPASVSAMVTAVPLRVCPAPARADVPAADRATRMKSASMIPSRMVAVAHVPLCAVTSAAAKVTVVAGGVIAGASMP